MKGDHGIALIVVVLFTSFLSAIGLGLALVVFVDGLATGNTRGSVAMLYAADAGIELVARDLALIADWNLALAGEEAGTLRDGAPGGLRSIPGGGSVDLSANTNLINCGKATACTPAQMDADSRERPWGPNNPRWRLFAYGPFDGLDALERPVPCYLAVWIADDSREQDGDPLSDAADESEAGHGVLRVRAEAYGPMSSRRALEAELVQFCLPGGGEPGTCRVGIRVQSWQEIRQVLP